MSDVSSSESDGTATDDSQSDFDGFTIGDIRRASGASSRAAAVGGPAVRVAGLPLSAEQRHRQAALVLMCRHLT